MKDIKFPNYKGDIDAIIIAAPDRNGNECQQLAWYIDGFYAGGVGAHDIWLAGVPMGKYRNDAMLLEYAIPGGGARVDLSLQAHSDWFDTGQEVTVDWGDGSAATVVSATSGQSGYIAHEYTNAGTYMVKVSGTMKAYRRAGFDAIDGQDLLTHIRSFGKLGIESFMFAFYRCTGLISVPKYCPKSISNMDRMFYLCSGAAFNPDVSAWDVSSVTTTNRMFYGCSGAAFNPDVSAWDVSSVTDMGYMFYNCRGAAFNPDVSAWNVSNVGNMDLMFYLCSGAAFNPDVSAWDVSSVTNMYQIFYRCSGASFNGNGIKNWKLKSGVNSVNMDSFMTDAKVQAATWLDEILLAWAALIGDPTNPLPSNITITFPANQPYNGSVSGTSLAALVSHGWTISTLVDVEA